MTAKLPVVRGVDGSLVCTDSEWRNRDEFYNGRKEIVEFLTRKWEKELDYRLRKSLWTFNGNRIAVRFEYEFHNADGKWFRAYGNEVTDSCNARYSTRVSGPGWPFSVVWHMQAVMS